SGTRVKPLATSATARGLKTWPRGPSSIRRQKPPDEGGPPASSAAERLFAQVRLTARFSRAARPTFAGNGDVATGQRQSAAVCALPWKALCLFQVGEHRHRKIKDRAT